MEQGRILAKGGASFCPGHEEDLGLIQEMTEAAAILHAEKFEAERLVRTKQRGIQRAENCEKEVLNQVEREQEQLAIILHNQRMKEERNKRKQQKHLEAIQEVVVGLDGGSSSSGMNEVKEVVLDPGTNENDISEDAVFESQDSPDSSGFKIGKDVPGVEGDIAFPQNFASK